MGQFCNVCGCGASLAEAQYDPVSFAVGLRESRFHGPATDSSGKPAAEGGAVRPVRIDNQARVGRDDHARAPRAHRFKRAPIAFEAGH